MAGSPWGKPPAGDDGGRRPPERGPERNDDPPARGPRNPWLPGGSDKPRRSASIEDIFRSRGPEGPRRTGPGGPNFRLPDGPLGKMLIPIVIGLALLVWLGLTSVHQVQPTEEGVVTTFGKYTRTLEPGLNFTLPWPIQQVAVEPVSEIRSFRIPQGEQEKLILTGDQNLVDLSYLVRWYIKDLKQYQFQLAQPEETVREVAEAAMRSAVAEHTLNDTLSGAGRAAIEQQVSTRMQALLDAYNAGIAVQGVEIDKTDPPARVVEAFKDVSAAQQDADAAVNRAQAYAQQVLAQAQGDATSFNKIYEQYRLAPEVTRRRLYYETMEGVLGKTDKTIVETPGVQTYLPLPEIQRRNAPQAEGQ
ncbi:FtsH protease activity modulator HflK [Altericroceibacterium xinjiangense]|uniref:FtsH protease activity modulator HflK n=1 Tax=Altericroceibacterium xinjiangense TaxID=762261 RepID=UPI000F7D818E|nr:FtsH protease activity modulator HflK [Altericroceibacterium xinjiangense]